MNSGGRAELRQQCMQTLEQSREDLIAGWIDDFDVYLEQLDHGWNSAGC